MAPSWISPCASCPSGNLQSSRPADARRFRMRRGRVRGLRAIWSRPRSLSVVGGVRSAGGRGGGGGSRSAAISDFRLATSPCRRAISFSSAARSSGTAWHAQPTACGLQNAICPAELSRRKKPSSTRLKEYRLGTFGGAPSCAGAGDAAQASRTARASVEFTHRDDPPTPALGRISLPPARHCLNPSVAFSVDSIVAVHAKPPMRAEKYFI